MLFESVHRPRECPSRLGRSYANRCLRTKVLDFVQSGGPDYDRNGECPRDRNAEFEITIAEGERTGTIGVWIPEDAWTGGTPSSACG